MKIFFILKQDIEGIKDRIFRDIKDIKLRNIRNLFENEEKQIYYKPIIVTIILNTKVTVIGI